MILNIGRDVDGTNSFKRMKAATFAPCEQLGDRFRVRGAGVSVPDVRGETDNRKRVGRILPYSVYGTTCSRNGPNFAVTQNCGTASSGH